MLNGLLPICLGSTWLALVLQDCRHCPIQSLWTMLSLSACAPISYKHHSLSAEVSGTTMSNNVSGTWVLACLKGLSMSDRVSGIIYGIWLSMGGIPDHEKHPKKSTRITQHPLKSGLWWRLQLHRLALEPPNNHQKKSNAWQKCICWDPLKISKALCVVVALASGDVVHQKICPMDNYKNG